MQIGGNFAWEMTVMPGDTEAPLPNSLADEAAYWVSADFDGELPAEKRAERDAWLAQDPEHARAYARMQDLWMQMSAVPESPALRASLPPAPVRKTRRLDPARSRVRRRWATSAIAASLAFVLVWSGQDWVTMLRADVMTDTGERRTMQLADGSTMQLGTHSAVAFDFSGDHRVVRLLTGEAAFTVAPDPSRPFRVEAGTGSATALGTRFLVRRNGAETRVTVTEHKVRIRYPAEGGASAVLPEGQSLSYGPAEGIGPASRINPGDATAWTEGALVFKDAPLNEVVTEIGRYHRGYLGVLGKARNLRVSGVFRIDDPVAAIDQLQRSLGLRSAQFTDHMILIFN